MKYNVQVVLPCNDVRILGGVVLLISRIDFNGAVLQQMDLRALAVVLPLTRELDVFESRLKSGQYFFVITNKKICFNIEIHSFT